jgi:nucleotidyltransferase/DNA polymerase involved in DNA repair
MTKTSTPVHKLAPVVAKSAKAAATLAQQDGRKRPIVAINEEGKLVVCCRRTAKKNGWEIQDVLYERAKAVPVAEAPAAPKKPTVSKATKDKVKAVKDFVDTQLDDILGK